MWKQFKQIFITSALLLMVAQLSAQINQGTPITPAHTYARSSYRIFKRLAAQAGVRFRFPRGFREIKAPDNDSFSFDFGMELPGQDFEIWLQVLSEKDDWASYVHSLKKGAQSENPDSLYVEVGRSAAIAFAGEENYFVRNIPPEVLARYNADAGKSYLLTLLDRPETKHYKYALLITLQKNHIGTIMAVCFTNDKGPQFYKNLHAASRSVKFK